MANPRKALLTFLKIVISVALIYFIYTKLDFEEVLSILKRTKPFYLALALFFLVLSKVIGAYRLNLYFHNLKIFLSHTSNLKLYLLGMFYNLFLPGGIGGDAYKGYVIKKSFEIKTKKVVLVLIIDRLSGLLLIFIYACILGMFLYIEQLQEYNFILVIAILASIAVFWFLNKKFFNYSLPVFWKSAGYSGLIQLSQLICVLFILKALSVEINMVAYLFIFLISSIVSVVPLTIGGIGSRELTFFYGASLLSLDNGTSVSISVIFFLLTALVSLCGIVYHFKKPELRVIK